MERARSRSSSATVSAIEGADRIRAWGEVDAATLDEVRACASALELAVTRTPGMTLERALR